MAGQQRTNQVPPNIIETVNKLIRTSHQMLIKIGREPTPEELANRLSMPLEKMQKLLEVLR